MRKLQTFLSKSKAEPRTCAYCQHSSLQKITRLRVCIHPKRMFMNTRLERQHEGGRCGLYGLHFERTKAKTKRQPLTVNKFGKLYD